jgi:hypothetical protein
MRHHRRVLYTGVAAVVFAAAGAYPAYAYICHPDPPGTRTLTVGGDVQRYTMSGPRVRIDYRADNSCVKVSWNVRSGAARSRSVACDDAAAAQAPRVASRVGNRLIVLRPGAGDVGDRLLVRKHGRVLRSWPLPERFRTLDVHGGIALLATRGSRETYAVRLSDGRAALVGLNRRGDNPQIEAPGIVYQDNVYKRAEPGTRRLMKFVPLRAVERAIRRAGRPLTVAGEIADIAMDGPRVAIAVRGLGAECDRVMFWNIPWQYVSRLTEEDELTCRQTHGRARIGTVAVGGIGAEWTTATGRLERVLSATIVDCVERIIATARGHDSDLVSLAADGGLLAYAVSYGPGAGGSVGVVGAQMRAKTISTRLSAPLAVHVDAGRVAVLGADGQVELISARGQLLQTFWPTAPTAVALRGDRLLVLTRDARLEVFDALTGESLATWSVPRGLSPALDAHFGVAVVTNRSTVFAVDLDTGRVATLVKTPGRVTAEIEAAGVAYGYTARGRGHVRFVSFAQIEAALR